MIYEKHEVLAQQNKIKRLTAGINIISLAHYSDTVVAPDDL